MTDHARLAVEELRAKMRADAKVWRDAYPGESASRSQKVNFANWITAYADVLTNVISLLAAQAQPIAEAGWQPIATARRTETILIYCPKDDPTRQTVYEAWWRTPWEGAPAEHCYWQTSGGVMLSADVHRSPSGEPLGATMWKALPAPPLQAPRREATDA